MEGVLILAGLAVCAIPFAVISLLVMVARLKARLARVEATLAASLRREETPDTSHSTTSEAVAQAASEAPSLTESGPWETRADESEPDAAPVRPGTAPFVREVVPREPVSQAQEPVPDAAAPVPRETVFDRFLIWLSTNWFYAVAAVSLALAGIFLVQYGIENGLLPPRARVAAALGFGAALIGLGEYIRRRWGDGEGASTAYLPSVFTGAGLVTLFGGLLSARALYGLIGPEAALAGMAAVALFALYLGWRHGSLLAAVGVIGGMAAPFLVGGSSEDPSWLYAYFAGVVALGLGIDTIRRWAWVSVLSLALGYGAGFLLVAGDEATFWAFAIYAVILVALAVLIPARSPVPDQGGAMISERLRGAAMPGFPVLLAGGAVLASTALLALFTNATEAEFWLTIAALSVLAGALIFLSRTGPALQDMALPPLLGLGFVILREGEVSGPGWRAFHAAYDASPEADFPLAVTALVALAVALSALIAWRALRGGAYGLFWGGAAALFAPVMAVGLEMTWQPAQTIGAYPWALHGAVLAVFCTGLAGVFARVDGAARLRVSLAALAALACITFALVMVLSTSALTLALLVTVVAAAVLDRRFDLPAMGVFVSAGVVAVGYRLVMEPGLDAALEMPLLEMLVLYLGPVLGFGAAWWLGRARRVPQGMLETGFWLALGLALSLLLHRWLVGLAGQQEASHWAMGLQGSVWLMLMLVQIRRIALGGVLARMRLVLAAVFGLFAGVALAASVTVSNPLLDDFGGAVIGPVLVNSLAVAWLGPAVLLAVGARRVVPWPVLRLGIGAVAVGLAALWLFSVIRHFWQGAEIALSRGMTQPELYTYTVVLLLAGAALFYQSLARGQAVVRRAGLAVIGLAVAKVFLVDISGLEGLTRVFSLLVLGLSLAGLAWLNRWAQGR